MNTFYVQRQSICPQDVLNFEEPVQGKHLRILLPTSKETYDIEFLNFSIRDYDTKNVLFEIDYRQGHSDGMVEFPDSDGNDVGCIRYEFGEKILRIPNIQTTLVFRVGDTLAPKFRMIERHFFKNKLIKSYDFNFGCCIPESVNTWEALYCVPQLDNDLINEMIGCPFQTVSDRFH